METVTRVERMIRTAEATVASSLSSPQFREWKSSLSLALRSAGEDEEVGWVAVCLCPPHATA